VGNKKGIQPVKMLQSCGDRKQTAVTPKKTSHLKDLTAVTIYNNIKNCTSSLNMQKWWARVLLGTCKSEKKQSKMVT